MDLQSSNSIVPDQSLICTIMKRRKFKHWWSTISPKSTKLAIVSLNSKHKKDHDIWHWKSSRFRTVTRMCHCWFLWEKFFFSSLPIEVYVKFWTIGVDPTYLGLCIWTILNLHITMMWYLISNIHLHAHIPLLVPKDKDFVHFSPLQPI